MSWVEAVLLSVGIAVAAVAIWARTLDVPSSRHHRTEGPARVGDYPASGGFTTVRAVPDPAAALAALSAVAEQSARTTRLAGSVVRGHVSYVTRSRVFGFPDVTNMWIAAGRLHVSGHAVVGKGDLGVNRARITRWLAHAGIA